MSTSIRSDAVRRCHDAFVANGIPWDESLASLPIPKLLETAAYWERRAETKGQPIVGNQVFPTGQIRDLLSKMAGFPRLKGSGGITPRQRIRPPRKRSQGALTIERACGDGGMFS